MELAKANPIRYRGYYYDQDIGLYYLNARYYSPELRRFISPDDTAYLDGETVDGLNLYAYCCNDPVNYADPSGNGPISAYILRALGKGALAALSNAIAQLVFDKEINFKKVLIVGVSEFGASLIPGSKQFSIIAGAVVSSWVENKLKALWLGEEYRPENVVKDIVISLFAEFVFTEVTNYTSKLTKKIFDKAPNYSQYQHYYRQRGFDYSQDEIYAIMRKHIEYIEVADKMIENTLSFLLSFLTYPTQYLW